MRIERLHLLSRDPAALGDFYGAAFGARRTDFGVALGGESIEITAASSSVEADFLANETGFQHFALVVPDIGAAYARLREVGGWRPISLGGPERLPQASGGAAAFKFRDPCGHPLELLQFPANNVPAEWRRRFEAAPDCLFHGIDHTGLTVSDAEASVAFYTSVGFVCGRRHWNAGAEQRRLDGLGDAAEVKVEIVSLSPPDGARPGVELLAYFTPSPIARPAADGSAAATGMLITGGLAARDPDGHRLEPAPSDPA